MVELVRDFIGAEPLYYHWDGQKVIFGKDVGALFASGVKKVVNEDALYAYLKYQYLPSELTLFKGIKKLLPAHKLICQNGHLSVEPYWAIKETCGSGNGIDYYTGALRSLVKYSIVWAIGVVDAVGVFLSGGLDSSTIAVLANGVCRNLHTFSAEFETFSEAKYAEVVCEQLKTSHHKVVITSKSAYEVLENVAKGYADPIGDAAIVNLYILAREARNYVPLIVSGDGGDEVFAGYPWHRIGMRFRYAFDMPEWVKSPLKAGLSIVSGSGDIASPIDRLNWYASVFCQSNLVRAQLYMTTAMTDNEIAWLTELKPQDDGMRVVDGLMSPLSRMLAADCMNLLPEKFLVKAWSVAQSNGIEIKSPLLSKEVVELAFGIPPRMKLRGSVGKYVLRKAVEGLLPTDIVWRGKQGFGTPLVHWLNDKEFGGFVADRLKNGELIRQYCKPKAIGTIVKMVENGRVGNYRQANAIWTLFSLQLWHDVYFGSS